MYVEHSISLRSSTPELEPSNKVESIRFWLNLNVRRCNHTRYDVRLSVRDAHVNERKKEIVSVNEHRVSNTLLGAKSLHFHLRLSPSIPHLIWRIVGGELSQVGVNEALGVSDVLPASIINIINVASIPEQFILIDATSRHAASFTGTKNEAEPHN